MERFIFAVNFSSGFFILFAVWWGLLALFNAIYVRLDGSPDIQRFKDRTGFYLNLALSALTLLIVVQVFKRFVLSN